MCSDPEYVYKGVRLWGCSFEDLDSGHHDGMAVRLMFHALCDEIQAEGGTKRGGDETSYHLAFGYAVGLREDTSRPDGGIFVPDDEPDPQVTVDQNPPRDYFRELCILAHEGGHLRSYKREEAPPVLAHSTLELASTAIRQGAFDEEWRAWGYAVDLLRPLGFDAWEKFTSEAQQSLDSYADGLRLERRVFTVSARRAEGECRSSRR